MKFSRLIHLEDLYIGSLKWIGRETKADYPVYRRRYRLSFCALMASSYTRKKGPIPANKRPADDLAHIPRRALDRLLRVPVPRPSMIVL